MKTFHELHAGNLRPGELQKEIDSKGYALIRELLPRHAVHSVLTDVTGILSAQSWLTPGSNPLDRIPRPGATFGDPDPIFKSVYQQVFNLESFHALPHQLALRNVMKMIVGDQVLVHPKPIGRLIFPNCDRLVVHAHQDYEFMGGIPSSSRYGSHCTIVPPTWGPSGSSKARIILVFSSTRGRISTFLRSRLMLPLVTIGPAVLLTLETC